MPPVRSIVWNVRKTNKYGKEQPRVVKLDYTDKVMTVSHDSTKKKKVLSTTVPLENLLGLEYSQTNPYVSRVVFVTGFNRPYWLHFVEEADRLMFQQTVKKLMPKVWVRPMSSLKVSKTRWSMDDTDTNKELNYMTMKEKTDNTQQDQVKRRKKKCKSKERNGRSF